MKLRTLFIAGVVGAALAVPSIASANTNGTLVCEEENVVATLNWSNYPIQDKTFRVNVVSDNWFSFHQEDVSFSGASGLFMVTKKAVPGTHEYVLYSTRQGNGFGVKIEVARKTLNCDLPTEKPPVTTTPETKPNKPVVKPKPPKKNPKPRITTQRKVFVTKAVRCVPGTRPYRVERIRVRWVKNGEVFRVKWSKPVTKYGAVCPQPAVAG
jgi:hypothetical protein